MATAATGTAQALDRMVIREDDYATALQAIYERGYTGAFTVHCLNGVPKRLEFPGVQIVLTGGSLDNPGKLTDPT
jgi:hypothetical protein